MTKLIALDDGHGMETAGKRTPVLPNGEKSKETGKNFMHENEFNRAVIKYLDIHLRRCGFKTLLVAPTDADTPLETRVKIANNAKADLYLSVHANALNAKWGTHGGAETFTFGSGESLRIGKILHKHMMQGTVLRDRGVKNGSGLYVIKWTAMPAVLVESAFMDNLAEAKLLMSDAFRVETARELAMGVCESYNVKYIPEPVVVAKPTTTTTKPVAQPVTTVTYRVRKNWADSASQKGAYNVLASAKAEADKNKGQGYKVFDPKGNVVYDPTPVVKAVVWYRVRKTWADTKSQIGAYLDLNSAKALADKNVGYKVFDEKGKVLYEAKAQMYRVRTSWSAISTQKGAFKDLQSAKDLAKKNKGYKVYDIDGKLVYTP